MIHSNTGLKKFMLSILFIGGCTFLSAQDMVDAETLETPSIETIFETNTLILPGLKTPARPSNPASDGAYIYQIGDDNISKIRLNVDSGELNLVQNGNANRADLQIKGKTLVHNTFQNGNGNVLMEYGNASHLNLERTILQNGNNQNLVIYGSNSLTESIRMTVQGDAEALTIRSFQ